MKYVKVINSIISIMFFFFIIKFYISIDFLNKKNASRNNYNKFLESSINELNIIKTNNNFKEFKDNSKYFKKNTEEKKFWQLLKKN